MSLGTKPSLVGGGGGGLGVECVPFLKLVNTIEKVNFFGIHMGFCSPLKTPSFGNEIFC